MKFRYLILAFFILASFACHSKERAKADSKVRFEMAKEYFAAGDSAKALTEAESAIALDADNLDAWFLKAEALAKTGRFDEAFKTAEEGASHLAPGDQYLKSHWTGVIHYHKGELEKARAMFTQSAGEMPRFTGNHALLGQVCTKLNDIECAVQSYLKWTELEPKNDSAWDQLGITYVWARKFDKAREALDKSLEINPKNAMAYNYLGTWAAEQNKAADAEQFFTKSIQLDEKNGFAHLNMGQLLMLQKKNKDAYPYLKRAVELQKDNVYALFWLGKYHQDAKEFENAAGYFERAVAAQPSFWAARMGLAEAALTDGQLAPRAEKALSDGLTSDPANKKAHYYYLSRLKLAGKDFKAALEFADQAEALLQKGEALMLADLHLLRGQIFEAMKKPAQAEREYWQAVKLAPKTPIAREALRHLQPK
ncbi:MAG: tetratricopeptide repeat protein [Nitrospinae bacterium]|nr:tetratricopeptide repeat protein [Nitrospinota bacterium]